MLKKTHFAILAALLPLALHAEPNTASLSTMPAEGRIDFFDVNMPNGEPGMGLLGLHYDLNLLPIPDFYTGIGMYGAVAGNNGGFFAFGLDNNYNPQLYKSIYLDSGVFVGGGGAHSSEVGGGLMILPHLGLGYQVGNERLTLDYSYATFPGGQISGSQVMLGIAFPSNLDLFAPGTDSAPNSNIAWQSDGLYLSPIVQIYHPESGTKNLNGEAQSTNLGLVGAEGGKFITDRVFLALRATAIGKGNANGYMNIMGGVGYQFPLSQNFYFVNDVLAGMGGGGEVDTGNGTELEADTGFAWQVTPNLAPRLSIGYLTAPDGHFNTWVGTIGLNYDLDWLSAANDASGLHFTAPSDDVSTWRAEIYNQTLFDPKRTNNADGNINLIAGNLDQQLTPNWYLTYGTSFAYQGDHAGGLALGDIGAGYQLNPFGTWHPHIALLAGAIGGGGVDVNGGFFVEPELGLRHDLTSQVSIDASVARMKSVSGGLNSTVLNLGAAFSFGRLVQVP